MKIRTGPAKWSPSSLRVAHPQTLSQGCGSHRTDTSSVCLCQRAPLSLASHITYLNFIMSTWLIENLPVHLLTLIFIQPPWSLGLTQSSILQSQGDHSSFHSECLWSIKSGVVQSLWKLKKKSSSSARVLGFKNKQNPWQVLYLLYNSYQEIRFSS